MIDWAIAGRVAALLSGTPEPASLPDDLAERAQDGAARVAEYTGLVPATALPPPEAIDRGAWIAANHASMRPLLESVEERLGTNLGPLSGPLRSVSGVVMAVQVGALTGLLSQRVLGQYDMVLLDAEAPTRLLLVAPNLTEAASKLSVNEDALVTWVTIHEVTHAVQFTSVPWLRGHLAGLVTELLDGLEVSVSTSSLLRLPSVDDLRSLVDTVRHGDIVQAVLGPERQATVGQIQATMSLIEGHAEHVMDAVGKQVLGRRLAPLRKALDERRTTRSPTWRLLERLLGLELKLRQYEEGRRFCDAVVTEGGMTALNRAWSAPELLPSPEELQDPGAWMDRTRVPVVTSSSK
jgi:coenzyme F420 biosynthesis associated uncharacterized protein